jgi:hypothetical protein
MDLNQFRNLFPDEGACRKYLEKVVWPQGRVCPHCGCLQVIVADRSLCSARAL